VGAKILTMAEMEPPVADTQSLFDENESLRSTVSELRARIAELERLADSDTLTPLPNRRFFLRELKRMTRQVAAYDLSAAVLFVDVDSLKSINDRHGHRVGDMALVHIAKLLAREVRPSDTVARIGGDEFGLLLGQVDEAGARDKARQLCDAIAAAPLTGSISLSVSIGVAAIASGDDHEALLHRADGAMYQAKRAQARSDR
jgi:diguanylate cyclase (GGDEF)-like protein